MDDNSAAATEGRMRAAGEAAGRHLVEQLEKMADREGSKAERAALDAEVARIRLGRERWRAQIEQFQGVALLILTIAAAWVLLVVGWKLGTS